MFPITRSRCCALTLVLFLGLAAAAQQSTEPTLKSHAQAFYPPLARQARIQGQVKLEFFVSHKGDVVAVNVLSGHPILAPAAVDNVSSWKFEVPKGTPLDDQHYVTVFDFEISTKDVDFPSDSNEQVVIDLFHNVRVITRAVLIDGLDARKRGCPSERERQPPTQSATDFVEMSDSGYTVRIHASGLIEWSGKGRVSRTDSTRIPPALAADLLGRFASPDYWALCSSYSFWENNDTTETPALRVRMGERYKGVSNHSGTAPHIFDDLKYALEEIADVHYWLHGDPRDEPLSHIEQNGYGPKPGLTPLMRAAARVDVKKVKALLEAGADPEQVDSSGWTTLMYARPEFCGGGQTCVISSDLIPLLLAAGAKADYSSPRGDTPLMAAAFDKRFETALVQAGANVNAQNLDGVSVLMILSSEAEVEAIKKALQAGANPKLKDVQGRTAVDYLQLAQCGKSPLKGPDSETMAQASNHCGSLDPDDFQQSEQLLKAAIKGSVQ